MSQVINAAFVSFDIVGHGADPDHDRQLARIQGLNECVRAACGEHLDKSIVWASGGDGGHVAFLDDSLRDQTVELILDLIQWMDPSGTAGGGARLRITSHYGPISVIEGADGRRQLVGDGINLCGSLLAFGTPSAVVASSAYRDYLAAAPEQGELLGKVLFHDERNVYLKHFVAHRVYFLSVTGRFDSTVGFPGKSDRLQLEEAVDRKRRWRAIYHAKRLLQVDSTDDDARRALDWIDPNQLFIPQENPDDYRVNELLGKMSKESLGRLIRAAHLIEREDGEIVCANDDSGDTMFIVLAGKIGVVIESEGEADDVQPPPNLQYGEGENLGELALALRRNRTATLQAVGSTALLAIDYATLSSLLGSIPETETLRHSFDEFLMGRVLEHLCRKTRYLSCDRDAEGPLAKVDSKRPWERLIHGTKKIEFTWDRPVDANDPDFTQPGIYVLAGGRLIEQSLGSDQAFTEKPAKMLDSHEFPLLYVDLPGSLVSIHHQYRFDPHNESPTISVVRIPEEGLKRLGPKVFPQLLVELKRQLSCQYLYDVFISYSHHDEHMVTRWRDALQNAGLKVYMSQPEAMNRFIKEIEFSLRDSLVMMPFLSEQAMGPEGSESWVQREIRRRIELFDPDHCNILPIETTPGVGAKLADGFSSLRVSGSGEAEMAEAIRTIQEVRDGKRPPPYARVRPDTNK